MQKLMCKTELASCLKKKKNKNECTKSTTTNTNKLNDHTHTKPNQLSNFTNSYKSQLPSSF